MSNPVWPITFQGWWQDGDQDDPQITEPWETFTVKVYGEEAGDMRDLLPADMPALLAALGGAACRHTDEEVREMAHQVWLKDQTKCIERYLSKEALDAFAKEER